MTVDRQRRSDAGVHVARSIAILACALLAFYGFPVRLSFVFHRDALGLVLFVVGTVGLAWLVLQQIRRLVTGRETGNRAYGVLSVLYIVVVFFALSYYLIELNAPDQFDGLETRTDALYYAIVTLGTVGYGDIHAAGQLARLATMVQIVFDLLLIGALFAVASAQLARRITRGK